MKSVVYCAILYAAIGVQAAHAGWFSYDNYEDCMLGRMQGQDRTMYSTADKACKKQFKTEFEVFQKVDWDFSKNEIGILIELKKTPEDIEITSAEFAFAGGDCQGKNDADFGKPKPVVFQKGEGVILVLGNSDLNNRVLCAKAISFRGRYR
ncbi:hypothetical protein ACRQ5Q_40680 [Bradyrhizobium sp. PMVTL-01]|uniref:hypothetical protein n=1 Tax=Bradyrhizobium sp. PMVTL-01 TaxID=3434999 RepID=UPI003F72C01D